MTLSSDYKDVTFWDPKMFNKYELQGRIDDGDKLRNFLLSKYPDYDSVKRGNVAEIIKEESSDEEEEPVKKNPDLEEIRLRGLNEDSILEYKDSDDPFRDQQMEEKERLLLDYDIVAKNDDEQQDYIKLKSI
jgi:hypothetical protein